MKVSKRIIQLSSFILLSLLISCSGNKTKGKQIDISQITYQEFYELIFESYETRVEWHHDTYIEEGKADVSLIEKGECETKDCGNQVFVKNNSADKEILVVVSTAFSIPNSPDYLATKFTLAPGQEVYLTCTELCFNGEKYKLDHEVVIAQYVEN